jgi:hypothetical protein
LLLDMIDWDENDVVLYNSFTINQQRVFESMRQKITTTMKN